MNKMKKNLYLVPLICLTTFMSSAKEALSEKQPLLSATENSSTNMTKTTENSPAQVRLAIGRAKIVAFSKDYLIKSGLDDKDLIAWDATVKSALASLQPTKKEPLMPNLDRLLYTLDNAYAFVKEAMTSLHTTIGSRYKKSGGEYVPTLGFTSKKLTELRTINKKARELKEKVMAVADAAFPRSYLETQPAPDSWIDSYIEGKKPEELLPDYKNLLKDYERSDRNYETFKNSFGATYGMATRDEKAIEEKLNQIEYCISSLQNKATSFFEKKNIRLLQNLARDIRAEFPSIISTLDFYKMSRSASMQRTVLSAYAEAMEGVLNQIIRETNTLLVAPPVPPQSAKPQVTPRKKIAPPMPPRENKPYAKQ